MFVIIYPSKLPDMLYHHPPPVQSTSRLLVLISAFLLNLAALFYCIWEAVTMTTTPPPRQTTHRCAISVAFAFSYLGLNTANTLRRIIHMSTWKRRQPKTIPESIANLLHCTTAVAAPNNKMFNLHLKNCALESELKRNVIRLKVVSEMFPTIDLEETFVAILMGVCNVTATMAAFILPCPLLWMFQIVNIGVLFV